MTRPLRIPLLVSLSFNAMFVIGYFCTPTAGQAPESAEQAANLVAQKLGLDSRQREAFVSLRNEAHQQAEELAQTASLLQNQLCCESASPAADPKAVAELQEDLAGVREVHQQFQLDQFRRFMDVLTPRQREAAARMLHSRFGERRLRKAHVLQEFDTDGDGKLSPAERARAIRALRERHANRREGKLKHRIPEQRTPRNP